MRETINLQWLCLPDSLMPASPFRVMSLTSKASTGRVAGSTGPVEFNEMS